MNKEQNEVKMKNNVFIYLILNFIFLQIFLTNSFAIVEEFKKYSIIQIQLKTFGYDPGSIDGNWGKKSKEALIKFQEDTGLATNGKLDDNTMKELGVQISNDNICIETAMYYAIGKVSLEFGLKRIRENIVIKAKSWNKEISFNKTIKTDKNGYFLMPKISIPDKSLNFATTILDYGQKIKFPSNYNFYWFRGISLDFTYTKDSKFYEWTVKKINPPITKSSWHGLLLGKIILLQEKEFKNYLGDVEVKPLVNNNEMSYTNAKQMLLYYKEKDVLPIFKKYIIDALNILENTNFPKRVQ